MGCAYGHGSIDAAEPILNCSTVSIFVFFFQFFFFQMGGHGSIVVLNTFTTMSIFVIYVFPSFFFVICFPILYSSQMDMSIIALTLYYFFSIIFFPSRWAWQHRRC